MSKEYIDREAILNLCNEMIAEPWNLKTAPASWSDAYLAFKDDVEHFPAADVIRVPNTGIGDVSDGYHTFNELYHHRAVLFSVICNLMPEKAWKSKYHDTGDMYDGMFIVGIETPEGQATYHYDIDPYWDMFNVKEVEHAPKWDGHTPSYAIERIGTLSAADVAPVRHGHLISTGMDELWAEFGNCTECGGDNYIKAEFCNWCGAKLT